MSRRHKAIADVLGVAIGGKLVYDFYGTYDGLDCDRQRCLTHLLLEATELGDPAFAAGRWAEVDKRVLRIPTRPKPQAVNSRPGSDLRATWRIRLRIPEAGNGPKRETVSSKSVLRIPPFRRKPLRCGK